MISEALTVLEAANIKPISDSLAKNLKLLSWTLLLPNFIFMTLAAKTFQIDKNAKFSIQMFEAGKKTEIDDLNGHILKLGEKYKIETPINKRLVDLVHRAEEIKSANYEEDALYEIIFRKEPFSLFRFLINFLLITYAIFIIYKKFFQ